MPDITAPTREEALVPPLKMPQSGKWRFGVVTFGVVGALGLGVAGGMNAHRLVDLGQATTWLQQTETILRSGFEAARHKIGSRLASFTRGPTSVSVATEPAPWKEPSRDETVVRVAGDLSKQVDQVRAVSEISAHDLGQGIERIRSAAEGNHRELVAKLMQLTERIERLERQATATQAPTQPAVAQPVVPPTPTSPPPKPVAKSVAKPVQKPVTKPVPEPVQNPAFASKAKIAAKQTSPEAKPGMNANGIANWSVRDVFDDTAVLDGPQGLIAVGPGDTIPGIGQVQAIMRSGKRWVVATTKGVIMPRLPSTSAEPAPDANVKFW